MSRRGEARRTIILVCPEPRLESGVETKNWSPEAENNDYLNLVAWFVSPQPKAMSPWPGRCSSSTIQQFVHPSRGAWLEAYPCSTHSWLEDTQTDRPLLTLMVAWSLGAEPSSEAWKTAVAFGQVAPSVRCQGIRMMLVGAARIGPAEIISAFSRQSVESRRSSRQATDTHNLASPEQIM